jgi:hypothetical protein
MTHPYLHINDLREQLKRDGTIWSGLLDASGGKLEMNKCFYYLLTWKWDKRGNAVPQTILEQKGEESPICLDTTGTILQQKEIGESYKTLGANKVMFGEEKDHFKTMMKKSEQFCYQIESSKLNKRQERRAFSSCYIPTMMYSLPTTNLTKEQLFKILAQALPKFLQLCGYERNFPRAVVHGPSTYGGIGMKQLYSETCCQKIQTIITNINGETELGFVIWLVLNWLQIVSGIGEPILESSQILNYMDKTWFTAVKGYINDTRVKIVIDNIWIVKPMRQHDIVLMDVVNTLDINNARKRDFNNWRLYFKVNTLSEITNYYGNKIREGYFNKKKLNTETSNSCLKWPNQQHPTKTYFNKWKDVIKMITNCNEEGILETKLGEWYSNYQEFIKPKILIHYITDVIAIYDEKNNRWEIHKKNTERRSRTFYSTNVLKYVKEINNKEYSPVDVCISSITISINTRLIKKIQKPKEENIKVTISETFENYINQTEHHLARILKNMEVNEIEDIPNVLTLCSDGGVRNGKGGNGIVMSANDKIIMRNQSRIPNVYGELTSYQSEGYGILNAITSVNLMSEYLMTKGKQIPEEIRVYCDNKSMIDTINKLKGRKLTLKQLYMAEIDIIL